jgi:predicted membrane protein
VALAVLLVPAATVERLGVNEAAGEPFESVFVSPDSANEVDAVYEHGAGDITYDFTELDFVDRTVDTEIRVGAGSLVVDVPADVTLVVDAEVGAGQVDLDGQQSNGLGVSQDRTYEGAADAGTLRLDVRMGFGNVEVNRENA